MYKDNQFNRKINRVGVPYGSTCPKWDEPEPKVRKIKVKRKKKEPEPEPVVRKIKVKRKKKEKVLPAQPIMTPLVAEPAPRMGILDAPREVFDVPDRLAPLPPPLQQPRKSLMEQELEMGMGMGMGGGTFTVNTITGDIIEVPIIDGISPVEMVKRVEPDVGNIQLLDDDGNEVKAVVDGMMVNMIVSTKKEKKKRKEKLFKEGIYRVNKDMKTFRPYYIHIIKGGNSRILVSDGWTREDDVLMGIPNNRTVNKEGKFKSTEYDYDIRGNIRIGADDLIKLDDEEIERLDIKKYRPMDLDT